MSDNRCIYYVHLVPFHSHIALTTARFQEAPGEGVENRRVYGPEGYVAPFTFTFPRCSVPRSKSCIFLEFQDYSEHFNTCVVSKSARYFTRFLHVPGVPPPLPRFPPSRSSLGCSFFACRRYSICGVCFFVIHRGYSCTNCAPLRCVLRRAQNLVVR